MVGVKTPIYIHPLQAMVSEPMKPWLDPILVSGSLHIYISQSARGELVMGASLDPYEVQAPARRSIFPRACRRTCSTCSPSCPHVKVMRQWAGMADMTPDFAPIMGKTPVEGFYLDSGWGTWGFKATPVCGKTMAHTVANDTPHPLITGFSLERFRNYALTGEKGARVWATVGRPLRGNGTMKILTCPINGPRPVSEFFYWGEVRPMPDPTPASDDEWADYVFNRNGAPGVKKEWWCHTPQHLVHRRA
jgi:hypothetical protein